MSPKFDGKIFVAWSEFCTPALKSDLVMKYINGKAKKSLASDATLMIGIVKISWSSHGCLSPWSCIFT